MNGVTFSIIFGAIVVLGFMVEKERQRKKSNERKVKRMAEKVE